jgi:hypothetical protein
MGYGFCELYGMEMAYMKPIWLIMAYMLPKLCSVCYYYMALI